MFELVVGLRSRLVPMLVVCMAFAACNGRDRADEVQDLPPGTVPVPGAASPGSAPDPHPGATGRDVPYPGALGPVSAPVDTVERPGLQPTPDMPARRAPGN